MALIPPRRDEILTPQGLPTTRFATFLESLAGTTNSNTTNIISNTDTGLISLLFNLQQQVGSGNFLTSDETGFTVDSTRLTVDMTEA